MSRLSWITSLVVAAVVIAPSLEPPALAQAPQAPGDPLRLLPPDAQAVLIVRNLREHAREMLGSRLAAQLQALPVFKAWSESGDKRKLDQSLREIQSAIGVKLTTLRDQIAGDCVVLSLHAEEGAGLSNPRGLLLTWVQDPAALRELIARFNAIETAQGSLQAVQTRDHGGRSYSVRVFRDGKKPDEAYTLLEEGWFAWSNSPTLVEGVIDRLQAPQPCVADRAELAQLAPHLPSDALARLFLFPGSLQTLKRQAQMAETGSDPINRLAVDALAAVTAAGFALEWENGLVVHGHQLIDPARLPSELHKVLTARSSSDTQPQPLLARVPAEALLVARLSLDIPAAYDLLISGLPESSEASIGNLELVLQGIMLGKSWRREVLPALGPEILGYLEPTALTVESPAPRFLAAVALVEPAGAGSDLPKALHNAVQTLFAVTALDAADKNPAGPAEVLARTIQGQPTLTLTRTRGPFDLSVAAGGSCLALGAPAAAVAQFAAGQAPTPLEPSGILAEPSLQGASSFVAADLARLTQYLRTNEPFFRQLMENAPQKSPQDLEQAIAFLSLFRFGFLRLETGDDARSAHQTLGLVAH